MLSSALSPQAVHITRCEFYTDQRRATGFVRRSHARFSDAMNAINQDFVPVLDTDIRHIKEEAARPESTSEMLVRRRAIIVAVPMEERSGRELSAEQRAMQAGRSRMAAVLEAGPYRVEGTLHLGPGVDLLQHVHDGTRGFMAVTDARVECRTSGSLSFTAPFILVNRCCVDLVYTADAHGRRADLGADGDVHRASELPADPTVAARTLAATPVFQRAQFEELARLCRDLCAAGNIASIRFGTRSDVFRQGDTGKALYIVAEGELEAIASEPVSGREIVRERIGPGAIVGEMAAISDEPRSQTVRTVVESVLLAVHQEAVRALLGAFPMASSGLLKLAIERNGGLEPRRLSLRTTGLNA